MQIRSLILLNRERPPLGNDGFRDLPIQIRVVDESQSNNGRDDQEEEKYIIDEGMFCARQEVVNDGDDLLQHIYSHIPDICSIRGC